MAHVWVRTDRTAWAVVTLADRVDLNHQVVPAAGSFARGNRAQRQPDAAASASLVRSSAGPTEIWALVATPWSVRVNGVPVASGLRVLRDRDEIQIAGLDTVYFSTERLTTVDPSPTQAGSLVCPRCRQAIVANTAAVCCPACGVWHHQTDELSCWTYAERCALCPQPTRLDVGYQWTPEAI